MRRAIFGDVPEYTWASDARIRAILDELVGDLDLDGLVGELSGGQRRRVDLCARALPRLGRHSAWTSPPTTSTLPPSSGSPTTSGRRWPAGEGALLVVTHDRWFLDEVCEHMWEVHDRTHRALRGWLLRLHPAARRARPAGGRHGGAPPEHAAQGAQLARPRRQGAHEQAEVPHRGGPRAHRQRPAAQKPARAQAPRREPAGQAGHRDEGRELQLPGRPARDRRRGLDSSAPGDRYGILGANGAGKSTLLRAHDGRSSSRRPAP